MPPSRWFAVGSAGESEREAGARAADEALLHEYAHVIVSFEDDWEPEHGPRWQAEARRRGCPALANLTFVYVGEPEEMQAAA